MKRQIVTTFIFILLSVISFAASAQQFGLGAGSASIDTAFGLGLDISNGTITADVRNETLTGSDDSDKTKAFLAYFRNAAAIKPAGSVDANKLAGEVAVEYSAAVPTGTRVSTYAYPEFKEVVAFSAEMVGLELAVPEATDLKPYVGVQFVSHPEFN